MSLAALRSEVAQTLTDASLTAHDHLPGRLVPPAAVVAAGSPYIASGDTYGTFLARWDVVIVVPSGDNEQRTDDLDDALETALAALSPRYSIEEVSAPYALEANGAVYPAIRITVTDHITL